MRQLHFHIGPGSLSFLRVHKTDKFGDRMDDLRHIIVDTNRDGQPRSGFETGRIYAGLRGVVPVFAQDPDSGEQVQVGAVEMGASFDHIFEIIDRQLGGGVAALLRDQHFRGKMWKEQIRATFEVMTQRCKCAVDSYSRAEIADLLLNHGDLPSFEGKPLQLSLTTVKGRKLAVTHLPLFDYLAQRDRHSEPVGRILLWRDVSREQALFEQGVITSIIYAVFGFVVVELLLFWAVQWVTRRLQAEVDAQTLALRQQQDELLRLKNQAETANHAKSTFLANMSHELRTPLNTILGFAQILEGDPGLSPSQQRQVQRIYSGGQYLLTLINDVLDLAKIEAGRIELFPEMVLSEAFFHEISDMFRLRAGKKGVTFAYQNDNPLPRHIHIDSKRLRQVVVNLLGNAVKFTQQGSVTLHTDYQAGHLQLRVQDTGPGIAPDQHEAIFQPFTQTGDKRYQVEGTGLGLPITRKIVQLMGGSIQLDSQPGRGSCFKVHIPLPAGASDENPAELTDERKIIGYRVVTSPPLEKQGEGFSKADSGRLENAPALLFQRGEKKRAASHSDHRRYRQQPRSVTPVVATGVEEADSGEACLEKAQSQPPHPVLMDLRMPGLNGIDTTRRLHALPGNSYR